MEVGGTLPIRSIRFPSLAQTPWQQIIGQALTIVIVFAAIVLMARRLAGALLTPLPGGAIVVVALACCAAAVVSVFLRSSAPSNSSAAGFPLRPWWLGISLPVIAISLSLPGSSLTGLAVMWLAIVGTEFVLWKTALPWPARIRRAVLPEAALSPMTRPPTSNENESVDEDGLDPDAIQTLKYQRIDGATAVDGWLRVDFAAGQRTAVAHVAFCPAFLQTPTIDAELQDGPACEIRSALVIPWGVKWELKLDQTVVEPASVVFAFRAAEPDLVPSGG
jgi:hypothetical protein